MSEGNGSSAVSEQLIKVEKGNPSDDEVAALVAVLTAAAAAGPVQGVQRPAETWGRPEFMHRGLGPFAPYAFPSLSHLRD